MSSFVIEGGYRLSGEIVPQGAKNEALEVICATLLTPEKVTIHNVPDILDVNNLIQLLRDMRVKVEHPSADTYTFQAERWTWSICVPRSSCARAVACGVP